MRVRVSSSWLFASLAGVLAAGLLTAMWCQREVGLADNGDFYRSFDPFSTGPVGLPTGFPEVFSPAGRARFYQFWLPRWTLDWHPSWPGSSAVALWLPGVWGTLLAGGKTLDLRILSIFPRLLLLAECLALLAWITRQREGRWTLLLTVGLPATLLLSSTDYLAYTQSFYQELGLLLFLGPLLAALVAWHRRPTPPRFLALTVCVVLLATAKHSAFYWPLLVWPFVLAVWFQPDSAWARERWQATAVGTLGALLLTATSFQATRVVAAADVNPFHSLLDGALTFSARPAAQLQALDLSDARDCLGQTAWTPAGRRFLRRNPTRITFGDVVRAYVREPGAAWRAARFTLDNLQDISLEYLGKYAPDDPRSRAFAHTVWRSGDERYWGVGSAGNAWNAWSALKFHVFPTGGWLVAWLLGMAAWFSRGLRAAHPPGPAKDLALVGLVATLACGIDAALAVLGDGRNELIKHLFLANLLFDVAAIAFLGGVALWVARRWRQVPAAAAIPSA